MANGDAPAVASYRDLGAFQLLLSLQDDDALRLYCDSVLGPLEDGGGEYGDELIRSVEAFVEQNGQWEKAARELFCHRHTLRYRIRRVEELTGRDLRVGSRPDRVLAGPSCAGAGGMTDALRVGLLGAGGIIAPAIVRDLAESEEAAELRAARPRRRARGHRGRAARRRQGACHGCRRALGTGGACWPESTCWSMPRATA